LDDCGKDIDAFIAGVGTGGTLTGTALRLKEENADIKVVAVEPFDSPLLSKGKAGAHKIQGIGANFVPSILRRDLIDEIATVKTEEAYESARLLAKTEGVTCGISGGAALFAAVEFIKRNKGARVVVILPDGGDRYLSTELFE
jgi:cysteine synthase A